MKHYSDTCEMIVLSSLEKVFPLQEPVFSPECCRFSGLYGEIVSFQIACRFKGLRKETHKVQITSQFQDQVHVRQVLHVPSAYPAHAKRDSNYISHIPGLYPDLLRELEKAEIVLVPDHWQSLWIDVAIPDSLPGGTYPVTISLRDSKNSEVVSVAVDIEVIPAHLPPQDLFHTEWFHGDCLADYYNVPVFSERHWSILENFISFYGKRGMNMILTPIFTPPLDTAIGGERTTIQLVDIEQNEHCFHFDFSRLERWVDICQKAGIKYFEMAHLFTQWGAYHAPKIMAAKNGQEIQLFGWNTPASGEYTAFLDQFLPALKEELKRLGIFENTFFHISDEPEKEHLDSYAIARKSVMPHLMDCKLLDALSDYSFYEMGIVERPVCATNHIEPFLDHNVPHLWSYYCTAQCVDVANRFMAMPSARNRVYGLQVYKYDIEGILHWGFNFYNSEHSLHHINPYEVTDCEGSFPSGDAFLVYPGSNGFPEESIRLMVLHEAKQDHRALKLLETYIGKESVIQLLEETLSHPISFCNYPKSNAYFMGVRNKVNQLIKNLI